MPPVMYPPSCMYQLRPGPPADAARIVGRESTDICSLLSMHMDQSFTVRSLNELSTTEIDDALIAKAANIGLINRPITG